MRTQKLQSLVSRTWSVMFVIYFSKPKKPWKSIKDYIQEKKHFSAKLVLKSFLNIPLWKFMKNCIWIKEPLNVMFAINLSMSKRICRDINKFIQEKSLIIANSATKSISNLNIWKCMKDFTLVKNHSNAPTVRRLLLNHMIWQDTREYILVKNPFSVVFVINIFQKNVIWLTIWIEFTQMVVQIKNHINVVYVKNVLWQQESWKRIREDILEKNHINVIFVENVSSNHLN